MNLCPCNSQKNFEDCCNLYLKGENTAPTAEALMRARYTAYALVNMDFILKTTHKSALKGLDINSSRKWAEQSEWNGLEIIRTIRGGLSDNDGIVEFIATYTPKGEAAKKHHEISSFKKEGNVWFFVDGHPPVIKPYVRNEAKVGRNDPCPCGSSKKYKKCCSKK